MMRNGIRRNGPEPKSSPERAAEGRDGGVQSVDRALSIIEVLAEDDEGYRLTDLAVRTGLSPSTVHRLLTTLEKRRFVQFDRTCSRWHIGAQSFAVGATFTRRRNFVAQAMPYLRKLRDQTRETANLAVVDDQSIIVLTRIESREIMRSLTKVGGRVAMVASGVGKAVLATYGDDDVNAIIRRQGMPRLTEKSIVRPSALFAELATVRRQGYAVDDEEARMGLRCVAAVVYNDCGEPLAAISVSGMTSRITDERLPTLGKTVAEVAAELTLALGGVMPGAKPA
ncbi:IclR family transcriptional regulator C-terminal domain-containing protein [Bradyrhizobium sp. NP1]|uniref:IclR family transcriptional regulator n=1 Tax=Bradyrhizobium sp. NP1 TaxID=3049772 RepID=UPI0025A53B54|nr:IclR family transcriptional regulator C-terminal domain-containing protein [Bradyrhizobium sp. NP1]WJR80811.1 IclR family transcriptional regulator C-terminal domain-containing protein [Bradyrhizobium sp. NP1]